jgi:hypothetical protein
VPYLSDLLSKFSKFSTSLEMGETEDLPSNGYTVMKETDSDPMLKFYHAHLTIEHVTSLSPNHRHSHMAPLSTLNFT